MRTAVLILMIALLPLRMWAASDMAIRMASQGESTAAVLAAESMPPDCSMMTQANDQDLDHSQSHCMACHLCAASAIFQPAGVEQVFVAAVPSCEGSSRFASVEPHVDHKPPIS